MPKYYKIIGPPGTGKTTTLVHILHTVIESGVPVKQIGFFSFSKQAVNEVRDRVSSIYGIKLFKYFSTIHAFCYRMLGLKRDQVESVVLPEEALAAEIDAYARAKGITYSEAVYERDALEYIDSVEVEAVAKERKERRAFAGKVDFSGMLENFLATGRNLPKFRVVFVDEAQDLSALQWKVIDKILTVPTLEAVYFAGDPMQSIYSFGGASGYQFIRYEGERIILRKSYRLPQKIWEFCEGIRAKSNMEEEEPFYSPRDGEEGKVKELEDLPSMDSGTWLILCRTNSILRDIEGELIARRILFSGGPRVGKVWRVKFLINQLNKGLIKLNITLASYIKDFCAEVDADFMWNLKEGELYTLQELNISNLTFAIHADNWEKLHGLAEYLHDVEERYAEVGEGTDPRIRISTIHGAKGSEADNVVLVTDTTKRSSRSDIEEERRVWYVGASRAKRDLFLLSFKKERYDFNS